MNDLEQRLTDAGERWRDRQPSPYELDPALFTPSRRRRFRIEPSYVALTGLAAVFLAIIVGVFAIGLNTGTNDDASDSRGAQADSAPSQLNDGQLVTATGTIRDSADRRWLCPPTTRAIAAQSQAPTGQPCPGGVRLLGDIRANAQLASTPVTVVGRWHDAAIQVTERKPAQLLEAQRRPAGCGAANDLGNDQANDAADVDRLRDVVRHHPAAYSWAWRSTDGQVIVGVVGDRLAARAALGDDVCLVRAPYSYAELTEAQRTVTGARAVALGIYDYGIDVVDNVAVVGLHVPVVTDKVRAFADRLGAAVRPIPWIRPVR